MSKPSFEVALALVRRDGQWLVARRHADAHLGGLWEFPGGKLELGESAAEAALRELHEECGVRARAEHVLTPIEWHYEDRVVRLNPVLCAWEHGEARALGNEECRWVTFDELRALPMPDVNDTIVARAVERLSTCA